MKYSIGIDIGTSSTKCEVFNENLESVFCESVMYEFDQPNNGWVDQNPEFWKEAVIALLRKVGEKINPSEIVSIGLTGQMHGLVMLDEDGDVIRPAILWSDQRTKKQVEEINRIAGDYRMVSITGSCASTGFTLAKLLWIRENEYENYKRIKHILLPKDYIRYVLTGDFASDVSDISGTQLFDIKERKWSKELLQLFEIDPEILPKVFESDEITGRLSDDFAHITGLEGGIPVVAGGGDNACAAIGTGVFDDGNAFLTIGTSGVLFIHTKDFVKDKKGRIHSFCAAVNGEYHVMGVTQAAGYSLKWIKNNFYAGVDGGYKTINNEVEQVAIGSDGLIYLPYLMGERTPHMNPDARGVFFGLSGNHARQHFARAVMEGVAFSFRDCIQVMEDSSIQISALTITGGGAESDYWCQMISDVLYQPVIRHKNSHGTTLGAAILGFKGVGMEIDKKVYEKVFEVGKRFVPDEKNHRLFTKYYEIYKKIYKDLEGTFTDLRGIEKDI